MSRVQKSVKAKTDRQTVNMGGGGFETRGGACFGFPTQKKWFFHTSTKAPGGREDRKMPVIKSSQKKEVSLEKKSRNKNYEKQYLHCDTKYGYNYFYSTIYRIAQRIIFCLSAPLLCLNTFFLPPAPPHLHKSCLRRFRRGSESVRP